MVATYSRLCMVMLSSCIRPTPLKTSEILKDTMVSAISFFMILNIGNFLENVIIDNETGNFKQVDRLNISTLSSLTSGNVVTSNKKFSQRIIKIQNY